MAIDTRDKRFSIMGLFQPVPSIWPNPDGTIGVQDRAQYATLYYGISLSSPVMGRGGGTGMLAAKHVRRMMNKCRR